MTHQPKPPPEEWLGRAHAERPPAKAPSLPARLLDKARRHFNYRLYRLVLAGICDPILMGLRPLPAFLEPTARKAARGLGALCEGLVNLPAIPAYRIAGAKWTVAFYGSTHCREDVLHTLFPHGASVRSLGPVGAWSLTRHLAASLDQGADLVIYERPGSFFPRDLHAPLALEVPAWVDQVTRLPANPRDLIAGKSQTSRRNRINRFEALGYKAEFSRDEADLKTFFRELHEPFIQTGHRARARSMSYGEAVRAFRRGALVKIMREGRLVAGTVCYVHRRTCYTTCYGIALDGPPEEQRDIGVFLDWHCMLYAYGQKAAFANIGGSVPLTSDGVFQKKRRWRAHVEERCRTYKHWIVLARALPPSMRERLNALGFIVRTGGGYYGVHFEDPESRLAEAEAVRLAAAKAKDGLAGLAIAAPGEPLRTVRAPDRER